jgi:hypothetical protein
MKSWLKLSAVVTCLVVFFAVFIPYVNPTHAPYPALAYGGEPIIQTTGQTGYTIFIRPEGELTATYPATFIRKAWTPPGYYIYSPVAENRTELWEDSAGTATFQEVISACPSLKPQVLNQVAQIRATSLARTIAVNPGISEVYRENYSAASALINGEGDTAIMRNGMTATQYLAGLGSQVNMTALQFAQYVIVDNVNLAPAAYRVEQEYMRLTYSAVPNSTTVMELLAIPADYLAFCNQ